jgi:hypothetical protein
MRLVGVMRLVGITRPVVVAHRSDRGLLNLSGHRAPF